MHMLVSGPVSLCGSPAWILTFQGTELRGLLTVHRCEE